jgi:hypothetical protein
VDWTVRGLFVCGAAGAPIPVKKRARITSSVRREIFAPLRYRRDGSVYFHRERHFWSAVDEAAIVLFLTLLILLLVGFALLWPSGSAFARQNGWSITSRSARALGELSKTVEGGPPVPDRDLRQRLQQSNCVFSVQGVENHDLERDQKSY